MKYDLLIIGGGPAAVAGGVYAARKKLSTLVVAKEFGGQSIVSPQIHNWIGTPSISGSDLAKSLKNHLDQYVGTTLSIEEGSVITKIEGEYGAFRVTASTGKIFEAKSVLIAVGANRRKLTIPGADVFDQKGLTYCATCDGPLFSGMDVAVIGGGNAGFESAAQLLAYVRSVTLLDNNETFRADAITVEKVLKEKNMCAITNAETLEIIGEKMVTSLRYKDTKTNEEHILPVTGIFVEIGIQPNTGMVEGFVDLNESKHIKVDPRTQQTSVQGIWAAGDCADGLYAQNNIAAGDAVKALEDIYRHLHKAN
jgi:alkyl hydroperoxide reductase subunit F